MNESITICKAVGFSLAAATIAHPRLLEAREMEGAE